jgi:uncharacterized membrane protein YfcA
MVVGTSTTVNALARGARSYRLAFLAAAVAVAGSAVGAWFAARPTRRETPDTAGS